MRPQVAFGLLLFLAAVVLPLFRQRGVPSWETVWAEDGQVYSEQAIRDGGIAVLLRSYRGYLQLAPRLLAAFTPLVPVRRLSLYLALSAAVVCALLAAFLYHVSNGWITSRLVRLGLASLVVLAPVVGQENTATITNTIWTFAAVAPWALVSPRERARDVAMRSVVAFLAATSMPVSAVFLPLALGVALARRTRATWIVGGAFAAGLVVQGVVVLTARDSLQTLDSRPGELLELLWVRVFAVFLLGIKWTNSLWNADPELLILGAPLVTAAIFAVLVPRAGRRAQVLAAIFLAYAPIAFVIPVWGRGTTYVTFFGSPNPSAGNLRYSVIPTMLLSSAAAVLIAPSGPGASRLVARVGRPSFIAHVLVLILVGFSIRNARSWTPSWSSLVEERYEAECVGASLDTLVTIPGALGLFPVTLPCRHLRP
jgi:hypothetical protein